MSTLPPLWNTTYHQCPTTSAPIVMSFSRSVPGDRFLTDSAVPTAAPPPERPSAILNPPGFTGSMTFPTIQHPDVSPAVPTMDEMKQ